MGALSLRSMSIAPRLDSSSAPARTAIFAQAGPVARAAIASGAGNSAVPRIAVRPMPISLETRAANAAPATAPNAPMPKAMPIAPADRPSSREAYSTRSALAMKVKKLTVVVAPQGSPQYRVPDDQPEPVADQPDHRRTGRRGRRLGGRDAADQQRGTEERHGIHGHRHRGGQGLDEPAAERRPDDERPRPAQAQLAVRVEVGLRGYQRHEERPVRHAEQHLTGAGEQRDDVELSQRDGTEQVRHRQAEQDDRAGQVGDDEQLAFAGTPVDPGADEEPEQVRQPDGGGQRTDLGCGRAEHGDRDQGQGQFGDPVAELRDRLADPQRPERPVVPQRRCPLDGAGGHDPPPPRPPPSPDPLSPDPPSGPPPSSGPPLSRPTSSGPVVSSGSGMV